MHSFFKRKNESLACGQRQRQSCNEKGSKEGAAAAEGVAAAGHNEDEGRVCVFASCDFLGAFLLMSVAFLLPSLVNFKRLLFCSVASVVALFMFRSFASGCVFAVDLGFFVVCRA